MILLRDFPEDFFDASVFIEDKC